MAISFKYNAAAVPPFSNESQRNFGRQLVQDEQRRKYQAQQAGYDRLFQLGRDQQQNAEAAIRQGQQNAFQTIRDVQQESFQVSRDKDLFEQRQKEQQASEQRRFMDESRKLSSGTIMDDIEKGYYDEATARKLRQSLVEEAEALGNPNLDATMRAEALAKIRAKRLLDSSNRLERPAQPNRDDELKKFLGPNYDKYKDQPWVPDGKGGFAIADIPQPKTAYDPKAMKPYQDSAATMLRGIDGDNADFIAKTPQEQQAAINALAKQLLDQDQMDFGGGQQAPAPVAPQTTALPPDAGGPPSPQSPMAAASPDIGVPPKPAGGQQAGVPLTAAEQDAQMMGEPQRAPLRQQQVKVGGKPLAVTPGTLTPQETEARRQIMAMPREQRIAALMPYDPELKGKTLDQLLEDPKTKAGYAEMTKQGLTTGNYREDMLGHIDDMLQYNVLQGAGQSKPDAYVGMLADDITDPKAKAEVAKMPRPKNAGDMKTIRGRYFIDPNGIVRSTQKQA